MTAINWPAHLVGIAFFWPMVTLAVLAKAYEHDTSWPEGVRALLSPLRWFFRTQAFQHAVVMGLLLISEITGTPIRVGTAFMVHGGMFVLSVVIHVLLGPSIGHLVRTARGPLRLTECTLSTGSPAPTLLRVAHLSDLHLPRDRTLETDLPREQVAARARAALDWSLARADHVFITGDITDSGAVSEWELFSSILGSLSREDRERIAFVPGNHDLSLPTTFSILRDGRRRLDFEQRCARFVFMALAECPRMWRTAADGHSIAAILEERQVYLDAYRRTPPGERIVDGPHGSQHASLTHIFPDTDWKTGSLAWPTRARPLIMDLAEDLFPLILHEEDACLVVALNSCVDPGASIYSGAVGRLGERQLLRLGEAFAKRPGKPALILVHHHLGVPESFERSLRERGELTFVCLKDAHQLVRVLGEANRTIVVFHGHKHVRYRARLGNVTVVSGPSVAYGDLFGSHVSACVYAIGADGGVVVVDEYRAADRPPVTSPVSDEAEATPPGTAAEPTGTPGGEQSARPGTRTFLVRDFWNTTRDFAKTAVTGSSDGAPSRWIGLSATQILAEVLPALPLTVVILLFYFFILIPIFLPLAIALDLASWIFPFIVARLDRDIVRGPVKPDDAGAKPPGFFRVWSDAARGVAAAFVRSGWRARFWMLVLVIVVVCAMLVGIGGAIAGGYLSAVMAWKAATWFVRW